MYMHKPILSRVFKQPRPTHNKNNQYPKPNGPKETTQQIRWRVLSRKKNNTRTPNRNKTPNRRNRSRMTLVPGNKPVGTTI